MTVAERTLGATSTATRKPVITTKDLRFFDAPERVYLPDGEPHRGMAVVAALSRWLIHTNRRQDGAWTQRYQYGIPSSDLVPLPPTASTGTTIQFLGEDLLREGDRHRPYPRRGRLPLALHRVPTVYYERNCRRCRDRRAAGWRKCFEVSYCTHHWLYPPPALTSPEELVPI